MFTLNFAVGMLVLGLGVGIVSAGLGVGGGILMVPAFLEFVAGMDERTAKGTSLLVIVFVAAVNAWRLNRGHSDWQWRLAGIIACGSVVSGYLSGWLTSFLPNRVVLFIFVGVLGLAGLRTFFITPPTVRKEDVRRQNFLAAGIGLAMGLVSGATGVGGGLVLVPLALIGHLVTNERVVALSNMVMVPTCIAATLAHLLAQPTLDLPWTYGQVNVALAPLIFIGAQAGGAMSLRPFEYLSAPPDFGELDGDPDRLLW